MRDHHHHFSLLLDLKGPRQKDKGKQIKKNTESSAINLQLSRIASQRKRRRERKRPTDQSSMVSRDNNQHSISSLHEKLQLLRSITHSHAVNEASIIVDASKYIEELKEKVGILNQDVSTSSYCCDQQSSNAHDSLPSVTVETLEKGFLINVASEKNCPGLLVSILEAFEQLNLNVAEATASCEESFRLEAISSTDYHGEEQGGENIDAQVVRQAVLRAIRHWSRTTPTNHHK